MHAELGALLGVEAEKAEQIACRMSQEKRLQVGQGGNSSIKSEKGGVLKGSAGVWNRMTCRTVMVQGEVWHWFGCHTGCPNPELCTPLLVGAKHGGKEGGRECDNVSACWLHLHFMGCILGTVAIAHCGSMRCAALRCVSLCTSSVQATIDQVSGIIRFTAAQHPQEQWDRNIQGICQTVNGIVDEMATKGMALGGV